MYNENVRLYTRNNVVYKNKKNGVIVHNVKNVHFVHQRRCKRRYNGVKIKSHIEQCFQFIGPKYGLGFWSEQAGEAVHREFLKYWERYKIKLIKDSTYVVRLKKAVTAFSSEHI